MTIYARVTRLVAVVVLAGGAAACATVVRGTKTAWNVQTTPTGANVVTSTGRSCDATPCQITMPRSSRFTATITKAGYKTATVNVGHEISGAGVAGLAGNLIVGGIIGVGIDAVSGATLDLTPNPSVITLERDYGAASLIAYSPTPASAPPGAMASPALVSAATAPSPWVATKVLAPVAPAYGSTTRRMVRVPTAEGAVTYETYTPNG